jgi:molybdopterin molybdotransferase
MIKSHGVLLVGGSRRGVGKTAFACAVIERFASQRDLVAVKVTTIDPFNEGHHPKPADWGPQRKRMRWGSPWITAETNPHSSKDTSRMLASGAKRALWLRVPEARLQEGIAALLESLGPEGLSVWESTRARRLVEPGAFVMVEGPHDGDGKPWAAGLAKEADRIVSFDGAAFDIDWSDVQIVGGRWAVRMNVTAILLAGGSSTRMGADKTLLPLGGRPMIQHIHDQLRPWFARILISSNNAAAHGFLDATIVPDEAAGKGPVMGIVSALRASPDELCFVAACDIPVVDIDLVQSMVRQAGDWDAVVPHSGRPEPLFAVYRKSVLPVFERMLASGRLRITEALNRCRVKYVPVGQGQITNLNTMNEYRRYVGRQMMRTFEEALKIVLESAPTMASERVELGEAVGRILARDVASDVDMPPFDKAAMDGYACRRADLGRELTIVETIPAGVAPTQRIGPGQCARIMTGAMVPEGADCVVMVEQTEQATEDTVRFIGSQTRDNICPRGEDVTAGRIVLHKGTLLKPSHIAIAAAVGCVRPDVFRRPRMAVISTGDELVPPDEKPQAAQIRNSNGDQLCAQAGEVGAMARHYGIVADRPEAIEGVLRKAMAENDLVLLSGGVSAGDYDYVPQIMTQVGIDVLFHKIAIKPGKPTVFGVRQRVCCFGLPGNPVSSFVLFELLVKPFLFRMMGHEYRPRCVSLPLAAPVERRKAERQNWIPVAITDASTVEPVEYHGSAHIAALSNADGLICMNAGVSRLDRGAAVAVRLM